MLYLVPALLPASFFALWSLLRHSEFAVLASADLYAWLPLVMLYGVIPLADFVIGKDPHNPDDDEVAMLSDQPFYKVLLYANVPIAFASLAFGLLLFIYWRDLSLLGQIGLILSFGVVHAGIMINAAHELIHRRSAFEQRLGGILLSLVLYPSFKIEHVRGHHVNVATPEDASTSRYGQTLYHFLARAPYRNVTAAWRLEAKLLARRGLPVLSRHNELLRWYALSVIVMVACTLVFGLPGLVFFMAQALVSIGVLETVNYLEHYGLERQKLPNGRYERTDHHHSWNSNYLLSNLITFQLQRHSDHHAHPQRHYQVLRHFDDSPQLPAGYPLMILLAMVPPLWMRVMNPRVERYYRHNE
ncbi:MAG: alkane 1-monooxygenase [Pseudomonadota bacterium]